MTRELRPPGRAEIAQAVPPGSRRAKTQGAFLRALLSDPALADVRADHRRNIIECCRVWARYASWNNRTTSPTRERVCRLVGGRTPGAPLGLSTYKACRIWAEDHGYLGTVVEGSTARLDGNRTSPALVDPDGPNTAAVYVLAIPREKKRLPTPADHPKAISRPPSVSCWRPGRAPAPARSDETRLGPASRPGSLPAIADVLRKTAGQSISDGWVSHLAGRFARDGWTARDVGEALDRRPAGHPDGEQHRHRLTARGRSTISRPVHWLRWRLGFWLDNAGAPLRSPSQARAAADDLERARAAAVEQERAAATAAAVDPAPRAARIRAEHGWRPRPRDGGTCGGTCARCSSGCIRTGPAHGYHLCDRHRA
jgi:hypothetical protein